MSNANEMPPVTRPDTNRRTDAPPPAWTHLTQTSMVALLEPVNGPPDGVKFKPHEVPAQLVQSLPMIGAAWRLLERAIKSDGFVLTSDGLLRRADVAYLTEGTQWPGWQAESASSSNGVCELDAYGIFFTRSALQAAGLLVEKTGILSATARGEALVVDQAASAMLAKLCKAALWQVNLNRRERNPLEVWVEDHAGLILWGLSVSAHRFSCAVDLMLSCTVTETIPSASHERAAEALLTRILLPLTWLGLLEIRHPYLEPDRRIEPEFRKAPLFDQLLKFQVRLIGEDSTRH